MIRNEAMGRAHGVLTATLQQLNRHLIAIETATNINYWQVEQALRLADNNSPDVDNIRHLGEGWVGEEALAIAVYAVARHIDSFADTLIAAVNHDGDSDSTGAIAGNIIGAMIGYEAIPAQFKTHLEMHDVILAIADDLHQGCIIDSETEEDTPEKKQWYDRYVDMQPAGFEE